MNTSFGEAMTVMRTVAEDPDTYVRDWKRLTGGLVVGAFPMNFPAEIAHAAGALPVLIQESREPVTTGRNLLSEFYCGYTRNLADQAAKGHLDHYDAFFLADHCIQLLGAVDVIRFEAEEKPMFFGQLMSSLSDRWTGEQVTLMMASFVAEMRAATGAALTDDDLRRSIAVFNEDRQLMRDVYDLRRAGRVDLTSADLQAMVKSAMVMDKVAHLALMRTVVAGIEAGEVEAGERIRVHLSGHFCHAPRPELLALIEECGTLVVEDDLWHGARYLSTDIDPDVALGEGPVAAIAGWYLERNVRIP